MTDKTEPTEQQVEAAQNGDLESFAALYHRYYSSTVALAHSLLGDINLAEDATQEAFVIVCRDLPKLKNKDKFAAWLAGICRNVARQMHRSKAKVAAVGEEPPAKNENKKDDRADAIRVAVGKLRSIDREVIFLRYYDNMPYEQIAQVLDISVQAVNGRLIRAKRKIKKYLKRNSLTGGDYETS